MDFRSMKVKELFANEQAAAVVKASFFIFKGAGRSAKMKPNVSMP